MSGHRQAAAALYGLHQQDRDLILAQLPDADQARLRDYLDELSALGFDRKAMASSQVAQGLLAQGATDLAAAPAATVFTLLQHEPASLVAQVLAMQAWRWSAQLLAFYPPVQREAIRVAANAAAVPAPARQRFLRDALEAGIAAARCVPVAGRRSALVVVRDWLSSWQK